MNIKHSLAGVLLAIAVINALVFGLVFNLDFGLVFGLDFTLGITIRIAAISGGLVLLLAFLTVGIYDANRNKLVRVPVQKEIH